MTDEFIPVLVAASTEQDRELAARGSLEDLLRPSSSKVIEIELNQLASQLSARVSQLTAAVSTIDLSESVYDIDTVSFTASITAEGKVAVLFLTASASPHVGINITLKRRAGNLG